MAHLETAQKIVSSPTLMAQFKKDVELSKKATVRAVAWLKDLRTEKEAQDAAAKVRIPSIASLVITALIPF